MKQQTTLQTLFKLFALLALSYNAPLVAEPTNKQQIEAVIVTMNQAVTERNLEALLATMDDNALRLDLFPIHYQPKKNATAKDSDHSHPKTVDLKPRWTVVLPILGSLKSYQRTANKIHVQVDGTLASAWVEVITKTLAKEGGQESSNRFSEVVLLKKTEGQWKIVLSSNNRHDQ